MDSTCRKAEVVEVKSIIVQFLRDLHSTLHVHGHVDACGRRNVKHVDKGQIGHYELFVVYR